MKKYLLVFVLFVLFCSSTMAYYCSCRDYYDYCYNDEYYDYYYCDACYNYNRRHCMPRRYYTTTYTIYRMPRPIINTHIYYSHHNNRPPRPMPNGMNPKPIHHSNVAVSARISNSPNHASEIRHSRPSSSIQRDMNRPNVAAAARLHNNPQFSHGTNHSHAPSSMQRSVHHAPATSHHAHHSSPSGGHHGPHKH